MRAIVIGGDSYEVPGEWNEFGADQLVFLCLITGKECTIEEIKLKVFLFCMEARIANYRAAGGERYKIRVGKKTYYLNTEQVMALAGVYDFLFTEGRDGKAVLEVKLTRNPFPEIGGGKIQLYGPDDGLTNISYGQFIMLQTYQQRLAEDWGCIDSFLAVIYKPREFSADAEGDYKLLEVVSKEVKTVLYWYYVGCVDFIVGKFPKVFSGDGDNGYRDVFDNQMRIVDAMADGDVTKKEMVKRCLLYDALYTLEIGAEKEGIREKF